MESYISVCISGLLYGIAGIASYNCGILYICSKFDCITLLVLVVSILLPCSVLFNFEMVGTSLNFSWNVF